MPAPTKRERQNRKRYERNRSVRTRLRNLSKKFYRALDAGDVELARNVRNEAQKAYDKAAGKGIIHRNKASRKLSRFDRALAGRG
ncbi:30S ribosomal protein S20 [Rubrobacter xylanophilus]|uniref:Small ribosomal subunit protein bS20 n=1 Tax=Rubrobacter xylanophilus TaxID=49319 RepID=A0A510HI83_9ACTN|nr:30S ribosomal protein S20 [Rubrobacter xylanophilus]BBL78975.1 30S ribosomal protein S20 [Rubrobacter xylanophilus]